MKANELRIGNLVWSVYEKDFYQIQGQEIHFLQDGMDPYSFNPIPLTEEWILKFGFDYLIRIGEYHNRRINEGAYHLKRVGDAFNHWYFYHKDKMITTNIRYAHQLQNLYFALTGEELTIKL